MCVHDGCGDLVLVCFALLLFVFTPEEMTSGKNHIALNLFDLMRVLTPGETNAAVIRTRAQVKVFI